MILTFYLNNFVINWIKSYKFLDVGVVWSIVIENFFSYVDLFQGDKKKDWSLWWPKTIREHIGCPMIDEHAQMSHSDWDNRPWCEGGGPILKVEDVFAVFIRLDDLSLRD